MQDQFALDRRRTDRELLQRMACQLAQLSCYTASGDNGRCAPAIRINATAVIRYLMQSFYPELCMVSVNRVMGF